MTTETYSRTVNGQLLIWQVPRLRHLVTELPRKLVRLGELDHHLDQSMWFYASSKQQPTCREVAEHARRICHADLDSPIILSADGRVMDGMHRLARAWLQDAERILAVQFQVDPDPDEIRTV